MLVNKSYGKYGAKGSFRCEYRRSRQVKIGYKPGLKKEGGWVKSLKEFNQALLAKWRWRMTCSNKVYDVNYLKQNMETFFTLGGDGKESVRWKDFFESYLRCGRGGMV